MTHAPVLAPIPMQRMPREVQPRSRQQLSLPHTLTTSGPLTVDTTTPNDVLDALAAQGAAVSIHRTRSHPQYVSQGIFARSYLQTSGLERPS